MTGILALGSVAALFAIGSILAGLTNERPDGDWDLAILLLVTAPLWLPLAIVFHAIGWLSGEFNWRGTDL